MKLRVTRAKFSKVPCLYDTRGVVNVHTRVLCKHMSRCVPYVYGCLQMKACMLHVSYYTEELSERKLAGTPTMPEAGIKVMVNSNGGHSTFDGH